MSYFIKVDDKLVNLDRIISVEPNKVDTEKKGKTIIYIAPSSKYGHQIYTNMEVDAIISLIRNRTIKPGL